jgi:hypothetical protein
MDVGLQYSSGGESSAQGDRQPGSRDEPVQDETGYTASKVEV